MMEVAVNGIRRSTYFLGAFASTWSRSPEPMSLAPAMGRQLGGTRLL